MTYQLRERPDGQVEIVVNRPTIVGVMADHDMAARFVAFLLTEEPELVEEQPAGFATAAADVAEAEAELSEEARPPASIRRVARDQLPALSGRPQPPAVLPVTRPPELTEARLDAAFARIAGGEKIAPVAAGLGITMYSLRGMWAAHRRHMQKHLAEGGQEACATCGKAFTPSITSPDKCARCAWEAA
jgi:hypothetical protein